MLRELEEVRPRAEAVFEEYQQLDDQCRHLRRENALSKQVVLELEQSVHADRLIDRLCRPKLRGFIASWKQNKLELEKKMILEQYLTDSTTQALDEMAEQSVQKSHL